MLNGYCSCAMTGRSRKRMVEDAKRIVSTFARYGIKLTHPVLAEKVKAGKGKLRSSKITLPQKWALDKYFIRKAWFIVDQSADMKSEGREHENGLMRYCYWRPVIRISPRHAEGYYSIGSIEDDLIVGTEEEAAALIKSKWGTWYRRLKWRLELLNRCLPRFIIEQIRGFFI
jgi:hypothetical protein